MVKKGVFVLIIAAVMITACVLELLYVNKTFAHMETQMEILIAEIETDEADVLRAQTVGKATEIKGYWDKKKRLAEVMLNHILLIEYDAKISRMVSDIEVNDRDLSKIDADQVLEMTRQLRELHTPHVHNIF